MPVTISSTSPVRRSSQPLIISRLARSRPSLAFSSKSRTGPSIAPAGKASSASGPSSSSSPGGQLADYAERDQTGQRHADQNSDHDAADDAGRAVDAGEQAVGEGAPVRRHHGRDRRRDERLL
jgi:hypothetical protein